MDLFISKAYPFAYNPCLYIVKQMFPGNDAYRCGSSGTKLFKDADTAYGSDSAAKTGLISRCGLYMGFWRPLKGTIYAALQIKRQLVSKIDSRVVEDYEGNTVSTNKGMSTLVRKREADFHSFLDAKGYRWDKTKKNELFVPNNGVEDLIKEMRKVDGLQMYLFNSTDYYEDRLYGRRSKSANATPVVEVNQKQMQYRKAAEENRAPQITLKLSKKAIDELRGDNPEKYLKLVKLIESVSTALKDNKKEDAPKEVRRSARLNPMVG